MLQEIGFMRRQNHRDSMEIMYDFLHSLHQHQLLAKTRLLASVGLNSKWGVTYFDKLLERKWIEAIADEGDERSTKGVRYRLTPKGHKAFTFVKELLNK